jgi:D-psicose/D-tagatose/L-ribulose 3-epimerase
MVRNYSEAALSRRDVLLALATTALPALAKINGIGIGVCGAMDGFAKAEALGFDYFEPSVAALSVLSDQAFADVRRQVLASRMRCESCNNFIRTLKVVGTDVDAAALKSYMNRMLDRCRELGAQIVVWGSASSRNVPEGYSRENAWRQIKEFLQGAGDLARSKGMVIAIEPLRRPDSNIINTGAEGLRLVHEVNHPNVKTMIDFYHMRSEKEDPKILVEGADQIVHIHFANPEGRRWPKNPDEDPEYSRFFAYLKQIDYKKGISIEGRGTLEADAAASLSFFRQEIN